MGGAFCSLLFRDQLKPVQHTSSGAEPFFALTFPKTGLLTASKGTNESQALQRTGACPPCSCYSRLWADLQSGQDGTVYRVAVVINPRLGDFNDGVLESFYKRLQGCIGKTNRAAIIECARSLSHTILSPHYRIAQRACFALAGPALRNDGNA